MGNADSSRRKLNVVITGGTKGIGLALAKEHVRLGDNVLICSRSQEAVDAAIDELERVPPALPPSPKIFGTTCDVSDEASIEGLVKFAQTKFKTVHMWVNNAGMTQPNKAPLCDVPASVLQQVINVNMMGTLLCTKAAINLMKSQAKGGHVFMMDGAGSNGMATADYAVYGVSKAGFPQLLKSLKTELKGTKVGIHVLSPGLVVTDLLLAGAEPQSYSIFNILAERPVTAAKFLVPRARGAAKPGSTGKRITFLTGGGACWRFMGAGCRKNRLFTIHEDGSVTDNKSMTLVRSADALAEAGGSSIQDTNTALLQR